MNAPHLAKPLQPAQRRLLPGTTPDLPAGWRRFASPARGLTFRYPSSWTIARQANYLFISTTSTCAEDDPAKETHCEMVLDLTPTHLYPYSDLQEYMDRTHRRPSAEEDGEVVPLSGGYLVRCQRRPCSSGKEFFLYTIGKGNLAYTLTVSGKDLPKDVQEIVNSIRFR